MFMLNLETSPPVVLALLLRFASKVSNLCTQFVDDCCIGNDVEDYCGNPRYIQQ